MPATTQSVLFFEFGEDWQNSQLGLSKPPLRSVEEAFSQLLYVLNFAGANLGCSSVAIETHYVDRDHMEDHGAFYSKSFQPLLPFCKRVHFFSAPKAEIEALFLRCANEKRSLDLADSSSLALLIKHYLGFLVVRPLRGSPVGRSVLKPDRAFSGAPVQPAFELSDGVTFPCVRRYEAHLLGSTLEVVGLAFQQQDVAVSACATTALWSSLQKVRDFEEFRTASPAQITTNANALLMSYGRAMPSEGLSLEQMCHSINALGLAPNLLSIQGFDQGRAYLYSSIRSGFAPILVSEKDEDVFHATTAAGMRLAPENRSSGVPFDLSKRLSHIVIHDDRIGPYVNAKVKEVSRELRFIVRTTEGREEWRLTHILLPLHSKIRLSISAMESVVFEIVAGIAHHTSSPEFDFEYWIQSGHRFLSGLVGREDVSLDRVRDLISTRSFPRYVGVIRLVRAATGAEIYILADTTSTRRNPNFVGIFSTKASEESEEILSLLESELDCERFVLH